MVAMLAARKQFAWQGWVLFWACICQRTFEHQKYFTKLHEKQLGWDFPFFAFCLFVWFCFFGVIFVAIFSPFYFHCTPPWKQSDFLVMLLLFRNIHENLAEIIHRWWGISKPSWLWLLVESAMRLLTHLLGIASAFSSDAYSWFFNKQWIIHSEHHQNKCSDCTFS